MNAYRILVGNPLANRSVVWPKGRGRIKWISAIRLQRVMRMLCGTSDCWLSWHCPSSGIKNRIHGFGNWNCFFLIWDGEVPI